VTEGSEARTAGRFNAAACIVPETFTGNFLDPAGRAPAGMITVRWHGGRIHRDMVLLLDDDDTFRNALTDLLIEDGYDVATFHDPSQVPPLEEFPVPRAVVLDYEMPTENGLSFADRFHRVHPAVLVIMLSAYPETLLRAQIIARPYLTYRRKPIAYRTLVALLPAPDSKDAEAVCRGVH
jgi:FixJ family two-component response regulator